MLLSTAVPISTASSGSAMGNQPSYTAPSSISANGQYAVFVSGATDLVKGVTIQNGGDHVYLRNLVTGTNTLVDVDAHNAKESGDQSAGNASISADGRYVAFVSSSDDLTTNDANPPTAQVYVRDMVTGQTYMVSLGIDGNPQNAGASESPTPSIAEDGKGHLLIAYQSSATNLTKGDSSTYEQVFLASLNLNSTGAIQYGSLKTTLVSADKNGNGGATDDSALYYGGDSSYPVLSRDGSTLVFNSYSTNLNVSGGYYDDYPYVDNLYLYSVANKTLTLLSAEPTTGTAATGTQPSDLSSTGNAFYSEYQESISGNGQYVVFTSASDNLVPGVITDDAMNVYLRNLSTGITSLVSISSDGTSGADGGAVQPVITPDGRYVAFISDANNLTSNSDGSEQLFVRDMQQGKTYLVSLGTDGNTANNGVANGGQISIAETSNGQLEIAYRSQSTNLTAHDTDTDDQVFVTTLKLDAKGDVEYNTLSTKLASATSSGNGGNATSDDAILSKDGSTLAFESLATNLSGETPDNSDGNTHVQVFAYNIASGKLSQVSPKAPKGDVADSWYLSSISDNGQYIAYDYQYYNSTSMVQQVLAWNASTKTNTAIYTFTGSGGLLFGGPTDVLISGDGSTVLFGAGDAYARNALYTASNWQTKTPTITKVASSPTTLPAEDVPVTPSISDNGKVIAFQWNTVFSTPQVYVDENGKIVLASPAGSGGGNNVSFAPEVSGDGSTIAYISDASNLVAGIADFVLDQDNVFAYSVAGNKVSLVSAKAPGRYTVDSDVNADNSLYTTSASVSDNGRYLAFQSSANDLLGNLPAVPGSVFAEDMQKGVPVVIATGSWAYNAEPVISGDGSTVAFQSALLLTGNDVSGGSQIFTASSWQSGKPTFTLVSVDSAGTDAGNQTSENPSISDNSQVVAFDSAAGNLVSHDADADGYSQIFVRNLATKTTTLVSRNSTGTDGGNNESDTPLVSADGSTIVFNSTATNLVAGVSVPTDSWGDLLQNVYGYILSAHSSSAAMSSSASERTPGISSDLPASHESLADGSTTEESSETLSITDAGLMMFNSDISLLLSDPSCNAMLVNATGPDHGNPYADIISLAGGLKHGLDMAVTLYVKDPIAWTLTSNTEELERKL